VQIDEDEVMAAFDLADRCGATGLDIGFLHDDKPAHLAGWWASASFKGTKITVEDQAGPEQAASALARRLLDGARCRCTKAVAISGDGDEASCRWRRVGPKWEPGCDAEPLHIKGGRGDFSAMEQALNRAERRRAARGKR
jgi:hypothetical protein